MRKKTDFRTVNNAMRVNHKHGTKIVNISEDAFELAVAKNLQDLIKEKIKAKFDSVGCAAPGFAKEVVEEVLGKKIEEKAVE